MNINPMGGHQQHQGQTRGFQTGPGQHIGGHVLAGQIPNAIYQNGGMF